MSRIPVVYIGPKLKKRDTVTGSRLVFPRHEPVYIDAEIAYQLLDFPTVFIQAEDLEAALSKEEEEKQQQMAAEQELNAKLAAEAAANSLIVKIGEVETDLSKMTVVQLQTLVESEELDVVKGAQEKADDFRVRVRDALNEKLSSEVK